MSDREFKIKIVTEAQTAGAQETSEALKKTGDAGKAANEKIGTETVALNKKKRDLKDTLGQLGREFPILGAIGRAAMNPIVAVATLATLAFRMLADQIKKTADLLDPAQWQGRAAAIDAGKKSMEDASVAANLWWKELNRAASETDKIVSSTDALIGKIREQGRAQAELIDADEALALAAVDRDERAGKLTGDEALARRAGVRSQFAAKRDEVKTREENAALNALLQERLKLLERIATLERELPDLQQQAAAAGADNVTIAAEREIHAKNIAAAEAKIAEYEKEFEEREKFGSSRSTIYSKLTEKDLRGAMASEQSARDAARAALDRLNRDRVPRESQNRGVMSDAAAMEAELQRARGTRSTLDQRIDIEHDRYQSALKHRGEMAARRSATGAIGLGSDIAETVAGAAAGADAIRAGGRATAQQAQQMNELTRLLGLSNHTAEAVLRALSQMNNSQEQFARALETVTERINQVQQRTANLR